MSPLRRLSSTASSRESLAMMKRLHEELDIPVASFFRYATGAKGRSRKRSG